jgi:arylsulfatase A-like enzyme
MDIFPTILHAAGVEPARFEPDGQDILPVLRDGAPGPHDQIFWEMGGQTAVRRDAWKLVLNGQLVEGAPPQDEVHLANLEEDMAEEHNLRDAHPEITAELKEAAQTWRRRIEKRWETYWQPRIQSSTRPD